jgi:YidC/Oxa1 family membrane protein insertase
MIIANVLQPLIDFFESILKFFHDTVGVSWGTSIILLTLVVRAALVPLTVKQFKSMQALASLQPEIKKLQAKYKDDKQRQNQELMAFYKENSLNPFGSCLPMVLQLPVFFSLFFVLRHFSSNPPGGQEAVDRGDFSFLFGFIDNITKHTNEVGFAGLILIVLYVASQLGSSLLMPSTMDKTQRYVFMAMPFMFVIFVIRFPVGLMLYWITTNLWTVGQQLVIRKMMPAPAVATPAGPAGRSGGLFGGRLASAAASKPAKPSAGKGTTGKGTSSKPTPPKETRTPKGSTPDTKEQKPTNGNDNKGNGARRQQSQRQPRRRKR